MKKFLSIAAHAKINLIGPGDDEDEEDLENE